MEDLRIISLEEVSKHNFEDKKSCWIVISGKVYDVTKFLNEHPGGEEVITQLAGQDATVGFLDVGHSKDATEMAKEYLIGRLSENETPKETQTKTSSKPENGSGFVQQFIEIMTSPTWTNFLIPTTLGIIVYVVYKFLFN
ncbi:unnamed protein product [Caenorhabditis angaria]|uniref:Cytochrome b5 heme-binding domain-containing protein n=1 Tax=Caenorhabditis angaria TaxID=860376 RepID=A0A9P1I4Y8_9PELO|nr:unnamed protein product [Caenorhabditis angaria]